MRTSTPTKEKLMDTAISLIWQSNYANVGVAEICKQAGVTKGSFYHYFETKADLFYEASMFYWDSMRYKLDAAFSPSISPLEQLENLITLVLEKQIDNAAKSDSPVCGCPFFTSAGQAGSGEEKVRYAAQVLCDRVLKYNISLIHRLQTDGILNHTSEPEQLARILYQYIQGLLLYGRVNQSLDAIKTDLRVGLYRILDLKQEYRKVGPETRYLTGIKRESIDA